jgi:hypothetical protein
MKLVRWDLRAAIAFWMGTSVQVSTELGRLIKDENEGIGQRARETVSRCLSLPTGVTSVISGRLGSYENEIPSNSTRLRPQVSVASSRTLGQPARSSWE